MSEDTPTQTSESGSLALHGRFNDDGNNADETSREITIVDASMWTHKRFIVSYEENGETHKRRIRLPSQQFSYPAQELAAAKQLFDIADVPFSA